MNSKNLFLLIVILIQFSIFAQDQTPERKWEMGIHFSPDFAYRSLSHQTDDVNAGFIINKRDSMEVADFRFTTGLSFRHRPLQRFLLETGLYYATKGY